MKIAIFSSADNNISENNKKFIKNIIHYLKKHNIVLVTGGSLGIPGYMVEEYKKIEGKTVMYSPDPCESTHNKRNDNHDLRYYDKIYFGKGFTERSLRMINEVDGAIALNGRTGTLCECLIAIEESLPLVVIDGAGGVCEYFSKIMNFTKKEPFGFLEIGSSYGNQIDKLIEKIKKQS